MPRIILAASNVSKAYIHLTGHSNTCLRSDLWVLYGSLWRTFCSCDKAVSSAAVQTANSIPHKPYIPPHVVFEAIVLY